MTKQHFEAIAKIIKNNTSEDRFHVKNIDSVLLSQQIADILQQENPRFDREKFLKACGIE